MSINLVDVIPGGLNLDIRLTVKANSHTDKYLTDLLKTGMPEKGLAENLGISGVVKVMDSKIFDDQQNGICATFSLMVIEEDVSRMK